MAVPVAQVMGEYSSNIPTAEAATPLVVFDVLGDLAVSFGVAEFGQLDSDAMCLHALNPF